MIYFLGIECPRKKISFAEMRKTSSRSGSFLPLVVLSVKNTITRAPDKKMKLLEEKKEVATAVYVIALGERQ